MTATEELLPCPICGRQPDFQHFNITPNVQGRIVCSCGIELRQGKNDTEDDMRIIWNTRSDYAVQAENERKTAQAIAATLGDADLAAENAKLRELVEDMLSCIEIQIAFDHTPKKWMYKEFAGRAQELGIEVDE